MLPKNFPHNNFPHSNFDKHFEETQGTIRKMFGAVIALWVFGAVLSLSLVGAIIYFLVKAAGAL